MISVVISGMPASGKTTVAKSIAKEYNLRLIGGGDILKDIAISKGYELSGIDWWDTNLGMKFLDERKKIFDFDKEVDKKLIEEIKIGDVVITSYTIPWLTPLGIKIWLKASPDARAKRLASRDKISYESALEIIKMRDINNIELYKRIYGFNLGTDLSVFNLVIETNILPRESVNDIVKSTIRHYV